MTTTAQDFWTQTPLNAVKKLMDQTFSWAQDSDDLAEMYMEDLNDFKKAIALFRNSDNEGLGNHIDQMDTDPREQLVMAFAKDCGEDFVSQNLGWELA